MAPKEVVRQLRKLSKREREILQLRCEAIEIAECSNQLHLADSTVKTYIGRIYIKFDLDNLTEFQRWKALFQVYCPVLEEIDLPPGILEAGQPVPIPEHVIRKVEDDEQFLYNWGGRQGLLKLFEEIQKSIPVPPKRRSWLFAGILLGILLMTAAVFAISKLIPTAAVIVFATPNPNIATTTPQLQAGGATQQSQQTQAAQVVAPTYTPYPTTTPYPTYTPYPTLTPGPTSTPRVIIATPTLSPAPPTPEPNILFQDNFDNGLSNNWKVESGNPIVVNGMLTTDQDTWLTVGDASWKNYSVELDVITSTSCSLNSGGNAIGVRVADLGNMVFYEWTGCETQLVVAENGKYNIVPNVGGGFHESDENKLKIVVQDNNLSVFIGSRQWLTYVNTQFSHGKIAFKLKKEALFDNFIVKSLD